MSSSLIRPIENNAPPDEKADALLETIPRPPFFTSIVAPRQRGKTTLLINMLTSPHFYYEYFDLILLFSVSFETDYKWKDEVVQKMMKRRKSPVLIPFTFFDPVMVDEILSLIKKENTDEDKPLGIKTLLVFDDMITEGICSNTQIGPVERAAIRLRHIGVSTIIVSQKYKMISKKTRENTSNWIVFRLSREEMMEFAKERAGVMEPNDFYKLVHYACCSQEHAFVHINDQQRDQQKRFIRNFDTYLHVSESAFFTGW